jgi:cell division protein FtsB
MTPRNTKQGASANARRASSAKGARAASSEHTPSPSPARSTRTKADPSKTTKGKAGAPKRAASGTAPARPKKAARPAEPSSWRWWLLPLLVIAIATVFVVTYYPVAKVQYRETRERARLRAELDGVRARNARLGTQVDRLKTPEGVEDYARVNLGLVKAGEHVGVVVDDAQAIPATITVASALQLDSEEDVVPPVGPWTAFLDSVFGHE